MEYYAQRKNPDDYMLSDWHLGPNGMIVRDNYKKIGNEYRWQLKGQNWLSVSQHPMDNELDGLTKSALKESQLLVSKSNTA
jgi:hypothetical protein